VDCGPFLVQLAGRMPKSRPDQNRRRGMAVYRVYQLGICVWGSLLYFLAWVLMYRIRCSWSIFPQGQWKRQVDVFRQAPSIATDESVPTMYGIFFRLSRQEHDANPSTFHIIEEK
jgi:hypothetical protein